MVHRVGVADCDWEGVVRREDRAGGGKQPECEQWGDGGI
jgi:hypothetical protein